PDPIIRVFAGIRVHPDEGEVYGITVLRSSSRLRLGTGRARIGANPVCTIFLKKPKTLIDMTRVERKVCGREQRNLQGILGVEVTQDSALAQNIAGENDGRAGCDRCLSGLSILRHDDYSMVGGEI